MRVYVVPPLPAGALKATEQLAEAESVHLSGEARRPFGVLVKVMVPVGVIGVPGDVSVTVAVHVVDCPSLTVLGEQTTAVELERLLMLKLSWKMPEKLVCTSIPPAYTMYFAKPFPAPGVFLPISLTKYGASSTFCEFVADPLTP